MQSKRWNIVTATFVFVAVTSAARAVPAGWVDSARVRADGRTGNNWLTYGRTYTEQRFSPLKDINTGNVGQLGVAWSADLESPDGLGATPIVVDGVIYMSGSQDLVEALDAGTGRTLWSYRPHLHLKGLFSSWTARANRGVAVWKGKVFIGTGDCRLIALDAATGHKIWDVRNCDPSQGYGSDGAPRVAKGMVLIGNGGADVGARGYVSAYDSRTGRLIWRFYTVPGNPAAGFELPILKRAAATWRGKDWWKYGGGTAWDSIVYDPELNRIYFGTDSAAFSSWGKNKGDALFTNCIIAVDADTGRYLWHYQEVPDDAWDYNATEQIVLAVLTINGKPHKVIMQAPKDGFFYVLDRISGKLLSAAPYVKVTWASGIDFTTGRPVEAVGARYYEDAQHRVRVFPSAEGAHNWQAMSFSPLTGLVYIPALDVPSTYFIQGSEVGADFYLPPRAAKLQPRGRLVAWDPIRQRARWSVELKYPYNGGTLVTAGGLVFQGTAEGVFTARDASDGRLLWSAPVVSATQGPPVTYHYQGRQYVLLPVGASGVVRDYLPQYGNPPSAQGPSRLIAFVLGGKGNVPPGLLRKPELPKPPPQFATPAVIARGKAMFLETDCWTCHGVQMDVAAGGSAPDLRYIPPAIHAQWNQIVLGGALQAAGMPAFGGVLSESDAEAIRAYVIDQAQQLYRSLHPAAHGTPPAANGAK
jgi:quinohemoprotein ethanol dehydrogenase